MVRPAPMTISQVQARQQVFALGRGGKESQVGGGWQGGKGMHNFCENFSPDGSVTANVSPSTRSARMVDARCNLYAIQICFER